MKVLIAIRGYYPSVKHGGPPVSIQNLCEASGEDIEYYIITTNHDKGEKETLCDIKDGWNQVSNAKVIYLFSQQENFKELKKITKQVNPDVIYIQSLFDAKYTINLLRISKSEHIPVIMAVRGELSGGVFKKKYKKIPYIYFLRLSGLLSNVVFHATFDAECNAIKKHLARRGQRVEIISNLPMKVSSTLKKEQKQKNTLKAVFISRIVENKNLLDILKSLKSVKSEVVFDIYGFKQDMEYWNECEKQFSLLPSNVAAEYCGELRHEQVISTLEKYDVMIFPTYSENYGQIIVEAMLSSCPVIITDQTPWTSLGEKGAGLIVPLHNIEALTAAIEKMASMDNNNYGEMLQNLRDYINENLDTGKTVSKYVDMFKNAVK